LLAYEQGRQVDTTVGIGLGLAKTYASSASIIAKLFGKPMTCPCFRR
jgi:hypothetical protein